jgi:hypothetical protein
MPEFKALLDSDEADLYRQLGWAVEKAAANDDEAEQAGRSFFEARLSGFADAICGNSRITKLRRDNADAVTLASAIADVLMALGGIPGVATVSVLLVRYGLKKLCGPLKSDDSS